MTQLLIIAGYLGLLLLLGIGASRLFRGTAQAVFRLQALIPK